MKSLTTVDYTRTCDVCSTYIPEEERLNNVRSMADTSTAKGLVFGWYESNSSGYLHHLCDKCYFAARLEGKL